MPKGLLLSNSVSSGTGYLEWCRKDIKEFFKDSENIIFIPYAAVSYSFDEYEEKIIKALGMDGKIRSIHTIEDKKRAVEECDGVMVGGGNTFALKKRLEEDSVFDLIKKRVKNEDLKYAGWSAGANMGSLSIRTTNDMPIAQPRSFDGFSVVDFQINPHYINAVLENHNGETRDERLMEFSVFNPETPCLAIPEGSGLKVDESGDVIYFGNGDAKVFLGGRIEKSITPGSLIKF